MKRKMTLRYVATGLAVIGACLSAGCATTDTASSRFPQLEENINAAKAAGAQTYAPNPLKAAETKLDAAKSAAVNNDIVAANRLVDEAMADADYARAKAPTEKAKTEAMQLRKEIQEVQEKIRQLPITK